MSALEWYAHKSLGDGIFWIQERFYESGNRANIWLVRGSEQDVVIDTGLGLRSLPEYLYSSGLLQDCGAKEDAGRRPLLAVATHVHFDHSGGLYQFDQVAVHRAEAEALARGDNFETVTWLSDSEVVRAPSPGWRARQFRVQAVQPTLILQDGNGLRGRALSLREGPGKHVQCLADLRGHFGTVGVHAGIPCVSHAFQRESRLEQSLGPGSPSPPGAFLCDCVSQKAGTPPHPQSVPCVGDSSNTAETCDWEFSTFSPSTGRTFPAFVTSRLLRNGASGRV